MGRNSGKRKGLWRVFPVDSPGPESHSGLASISDDDNLAAP